jgi:hypothetical protein
MVNVVAPVILAAKTEAKIVHANNRHAANAKNSSTPFYHSPTPPSNWLRQCGPLIQPKKSKNMKAIQKLLLVAVVMTTFGLCFSTSAQNVNREEIQRQTERLREPLGVTDNDEWAIISKRLAKVIELRAAGGGNRDDRGRGGRGQGQAGRDREQTNRGQGDRDRDGAQADRGGRGRGQGDRAQSGQGGRERGQGDRAQGGQGRRERGQGDRGRDGRGGNVDPNSPQGKLQAALVRNSSEGELNRLLQAYRAERESNAKKLEQARAALREVLTVRQEVVLVMNRLLN